MARTFSSIGGFAVDLSRREWYTFGNKSLKRVEIYAK